MSLSCPERRPCARLRSLHPAGVALALFAAALLSSCAAWTPGRVVQRGEPGHAAPGVTVVQRAALPTGSPSGGSPHGHAASRADRMVAAAPDGLVTAARISTRAAPSPVPATETRAAARAAPAYLAHLAPALTGVASDAVPDAERSGPSTPALQEPGITHIAFNVPTSMTLERRTLIQLALGSDAAPGPARETADTPADLAQYIEARLSGSGFIIEPVTEDRQAVDQAQPTEWLWLVTPTRPGRHQLHLTVTAMAEAGSAPVRRTLPTFDHTVDVGLTWQEELRTRTAAYAVRLWPLLWLAPLLLLGLYARWRRKHRRWFHSRM